MEIGGALPKARVASAKMMRFGVNLRLHMMKLRRGRSKGGGDSGTIVKETGNEKYPALTCMGFMPPVDFRV